jgi:hypothetical protein
MLYVLLLLFYYIFPKILLQVYDVEVRFVSTNSEFRIVSIF